VKRVIDQANQLNEQFGSDLDKITDSLGLTVMYEEMIGRMKEFYFRGAIVVRSDLALREKRELIAHALGHHLFHAGNHLSMQKRIYSFGNYHEKQANAFAACLLIPLSRLLGLMADRARIDEIADNFGVTEELVRLRLMIWANFEKDLSGSSAGVG
jgi:Zn-dependent peptidase ImmA (M78 family)